MGSWASNVAFKLWKHLISHVQEGALIPIQSPDESPDGSGAVGISMIALRRRRLRLVLCPCGAGRGDLGRGSWVCCSRVGEEGGGRKGEEEAERRWPAVIIYWIVCVVVFGSPCHQYRRTPASANARLFLRYHHQRNTLYLSPFHMHFLLLEIEILALKSSNRTREVRESSPG